MNHRILLCLALILGNCLVASADCEGSQPGDVEYDCANNVEDDKTLEAIDEKIDDIVDVSPDDDDDDEDDYYEKIENQPESPESTSTTTTTEKSVQEEEQDDEEEYDSEDDVLDTQQDETQNDEEETTEHTGIQNESESTTIQPLAEQKEDDQHINLFYDAIKTTLTSTNYTNAYRYVKHPERVECMIAEMRKHRVMDKINATSYSFSEHEAKFEFRNVTTFMYDLEREIQDANFDCTGMGNTRIYILILIAILAVVLLVLYIRRRQR
ncbi:bromodomain-containing protein DDB_G0278469-like [Chironomus tepperi]|uniref:bromodomain-containing protein DDB_G0278469-like n=1 Tax=Chironomus tepperi TaxID=113505 RepID=UPI00391EEA1B